MTTPDFADQLKLGIAALKAGKREKARVLLMQLIEADENNEQAWLWLSGAVETDEDRRICLENVLALNPDNQVAQKGMAKLQAAEETAVSPPSIPPQQTIQRTITPPNLAGAILYPERYTQEWQWQDPTPNRQVPTAGFSQTSAYHDVWEREDEICAYCAHLLADTDKKCPGCGHNLIQQSYRYEKPETSLHLLWVLLAGLSQLYLLQAIYNILVTRNIWSPLLPLLMMGVFLVLMAGVYFRQYWAFMATILLLILLLALGLIGFLMPAALSPVAMLQTDPIFDNVVNPAINFLGTILRGFQFIAMILALAIAVFKTAPDFEREEKRVIASVKKGLQSTGSYHAAARHAAKEGQWATAVLHWQRAAALAPGNWQFQRQLGIAYARLGFYQRSADILQTALLITPNPEQQAQINRLLASVQKQLSTETEND